jgi:hypothetical protein
MLPIFTTTNQNVTTNLTYLVLDINEGTFEVEAKTKKFKRLNQTTLSTNNLLSLPHLFAKKMNSKDPLVDYSQNHVVTSNQYFNIMR